jgi:hypothetical protein
MNVWLSSQAVTRLSDLLAVVAAVPHISDQCHYQAQSCRNQIEELMPASELLLLAGVLREATGRAGLSAATRTDCWSWSSYLESLLVGSPTATAMTTQPVGRARPARNAVLVPGPDHRPVEATARRPRRVGATPSIARSGSAACGA